MKEEKPVFVKTIYLANQKVVFTENLLSMSHKDAGVLVKLFGGTVQRKVTEKTTLLVRGGVYTRGKKSETLTFAEQLIVRGYPLKIVSEQEFLLLINEGIVEKIRQSYLLTAGETMY